MASVSVTGLVTCKQGESPVALKQFDSGDSVASFSVVDREYVYAPKGEEALGQFYRVEIRGKAAITASERLNRGDRVGVSGQLVQREYNGRLYLDVKNARLTYLEKRKDSDAF